MGGGGGGRGSGTKAKREDAELLLTEEHRVVLDLRVVVLVLDFEWFVLGRISEPDPDSLHHHNMHLTQPFYYLFEK